MRAPSAPIASLDDLQPGQTGLIADVLPPHGLEAWRPWLTALGFEPGEPVRLLSRARPGGDPLCVRVGGSTFALRRAEAACIRLWHEVPHATAPGAPDTPDASDGLRDAPQPAARDRAR